MNVAGSSPVTRFVPYDGTLLASNGQQCLLMDSRYAFRGVSGDLGVTRARVESSVECQHVTGEDSSGLESVQAQVQGSGW